MSRPRRKSSSLGAELRGDTGAPAVSTLQPKPQLVSPPLSPRPSAASVPRASKRRKARSLFRRWKNLSFQHTWVNPLIVVLVILSAYAWNPTPSNPLHAAIFLSYALPAKSPLIPEFARNDPNAPTYYGKGRIDIAFVSFYIVVLSFTREFLMQRLIRPLAIRWGIRTRSKQSRFMEQAYTAIYFSIFGPYGVYVMSRTPVGYFNTDAMYEAFPHKSHEALFKAYYLLQGSYWAQQAIVLCLQLEKPRKDFKELVGHHIVTLALIALSYRFHFTYLGLAVYITHDISDFFLATSKCLNYLNSRLTVGYFTLFILVWVYLRHLINLRILYSVATAFRTVGPFELDWATQQYKCTLSQYITFSLLAILQAINLFWLFLILRVAYNIVFARLVEDLRSDDEDEESSTTARKSTGGKRGKVQGPASSASAVEVEGYEGALEERKVVNGTVPEARGNGSAVKGSAGRKEGESCVDALKENRKRQ